MHFCATPSQITEVNCTEPIGSSAYPPLITFETWKVSIRSYGMHALTVYARWHVKDLISSNYHLRVVNSLLRDVLVTSTPEAADWARLSLTQAPALPLEAWSVHQRRQHWISPGNEQCPKHLTVRRSSSGSSTSAWWDSSGVLQSNSFWVAKHGHDHPAPAPNTLLNSEQFSEAWSDQKVSDSHHENESPLPSGCLCMFKMTKQELYLKVGSDYFPVCLTQQGFAQRATFGLVSQFTWGKAAKSPKEPEEHGWSNWLGKRVTQKGPQRYLLLIWFSYNTHITLFNQTLNFFVTWFNLWKKICIK